ncbi:MAG: methylenetetrahydrofolate reductase [Gammaproteobacteria bacterium]|nr:methylenetetrahydrofolate reductase [Gammaproteobacteria bacterium]MDH4254591.1 methylenetetrahydrofolate reductase [Gammaproteobacteria bacterium]MDH5311390.1 methylenetetrahydrofolate reductase [Gammaproteobacteria bacterium]
MKTFKDAMRRGDFAVSAEIFLRPESDADSIREQAAVLKDVVDAILVTDNQYGQLHMSPLVAASLLLAIGVDPIVQVTSRNRNRIALVSDLLGAGALGVTTLLLAAGERAPKGFEPRPKPVLDLKATDLIRTAATIRADERLYQRPDFLIGGLVTPVSPGPRWKPAKLLEKIDAGAQFVQTHLCMNVELLRRYLRRLVSEGLTHKTSVVVSVAVLQSADDARWLKENRPNVMIPDDIISRMDQAKDPAAEGVQICAEIIRALRKVPGVEGVSIMATQDLTSIPRAIRAAGLGGGSE